ncbi:hypothetical protein [Mycolicibacterium pulveris]
MSATESPKQQIGKDKAIAMAVAADVVCLAFGVALGMASPLQPSGSS